MAYTYAGAQHSHPPETWQRRSDMAAHGYQGNLDDMSQIASYAYAVLGMNSSEVASYLRGEARRLKREADGRRSGRAMFA